MKRAFLAGCLVGAGLLLWAIARSMGTAEPKPTIHRHVWNHRVMPYGEHSWRTACSCGAIEAEDEPPSDPYVLAQAAELLRREGFG